MSPKNPLPAADLSALLNGNSRPPQAPTERDYPQSERLSDSGPSLKTPRAVPKT